MPKKARRRVLSCLAALIVAAACGRPSSTPTAPTPAAATVTVNFRGVVHEKASTGLRPVAGAQVVWCDVARCRPAQSVLTDAAGRYEIQAAEALAFVYLLVSKPGYLQTRSAVFAASGNTELDMEISAVASGVNLLFGLVYEATPTGSVPVAGASVWTCEDFFYESCALATTGIDGRYVADWTGVVYLLVARPGFYSHWNSLIVNASIEYNVVLVRQ